MSGFPAGYESNSDDDDEHEYYEPEVSSYVQPENTGDKTSNRGPFSNVNQANLQDIEEQVSLNSEDMRMAILKKNISYVQKALDKGFNTETKMQSGWTALMYAASNGFDDVVKLLLEKKALPNFQKDLFTPLMAVCYSSVRNEDNLVACAQLLITAGAKVNVHDRHVMTPLMYAAKLGYARLVTLLCENHAEINMQDAQGWSALTFAAANGYSHVVRVLLKFHADYNQTTYDGQKPVDVAFSYGFTMLAEMLEKYDGDNLEQFQNIPSASSTKNSVLSSKYVKYGDLELFLYGLELGHLIPIIQEHQLQFTDVLKMTEEEMVEIGITQLGVRKKLIESIRDIHTNEWDISSLSKEQQISKLTTLETAAIVANITKHLQFIHSSVIYVNKHLSLKRDELLSDNVTLQKALVDQCCEVLQVSKTLQTDIIGLRNDAVNMFPNVNKNAADLIVAPKEKTNLINSLLFPVGIIVIVSGSLFAAYRIFNQKDG